MVSSQLTLYKGALRILGARSIASISENRESVRLLNDVWDNDAVAYCLEQGYFIFARRTIKIDYDPDFTPNFGYQFAFTKPDDYDHTSSVWTDPEMNTPLTDYSDEDTVIYANISPIYVQYISLDPKYGTNYAAWSQVFTQFVQAYLAKEIAPRLTLSSERIKFAQDNYKDALLTARNFDVMNQPQRIMPLGTWNQARRGNFRGADFSTSGGI